MLVDPVLDDRVRLAAADLHDRPGPRHGPRDRRRQLRGRRAVAVFVEVLHDDGVLQLVELVHLLEELEDPPRLGLVDPRQGEADVDEDVIVERASGTCSRQTRLKIPPKSTLPMSTSCSR